MLSQLGIGLCLELVGGHALLGGKINIMYGRDPDTAHIVLCGLSGVSARYHQHGQRQHDRIECAFFSMKNLLLSGSCFHNHCIPLLVKSSFAQICYPYIIAQPIGEI